MQFKLNGEELDLNFIKSIKKDIKKPISIISLANKYNVAPKVIQKALDILIESKHNIYYTSDEVHMSKDVINNKRLRIDVTNFKNRTYKFGFVSDDHLCNKAERLDVLNAIFDIYEEEGITDVYNGGNWIDGEAKFNKLDIHTFGMDNQISYFIKNYPSRKNIKIKFIAGDDHEGWYQQREGVIIGEYMEMKAKKEGRNDLEYLGYMESDIELKTERGKSKLRIIHAGGGTAYALSYKPQKIVESLQGGDKPSILLIGHYHKAEFLPSYRNVKIIQAGTTSDQTRFMRKNSIEAQVGGWIVEIQLSKDGAIHRIKTEFISFFDKNYYKQKKYYIKT